MESNHTMLIALYVLLSSVLIIECRSGRQTSSKDRRSATQTVTPPEKKSEPIVQKPRPIEIQKTTPRPKSAVEKTPLKKTTEQNLSDNKGEEFSGKATNVKPATKKDKAPEDLLYRIFLIKLKESANLTEGIIQYIFNNLLNKINQSDQSNSKILLLAKNYFYGLRYPLYRHLREIVSECTDPNAFLCGGIIESIAKSDNTPVKKKALFSALNRLGAQLKKFKLHQIDNKLEEELEEHLGKLEEIINGPNVNERQKQLINDYYIMPLDLLKKCIADPSIKTILPPRESTLYYMYRKGAKKALNTGTAVAKWLGKRTVALAAKKILNYYNSLIPEQLTIEQTTAEQKSKKLTEKVNLLSNLSNIDTKISTPFSALYTQWKGPKPILEKKQFGIDSIWQSIKSSTCSYAFNMYEQEVYSIIQGTLSGLMNIPITMMKNMAKSKIKKISPPDLGNANLNFMTVSATFIIEYTQTLCSAIINNNTDIHQTTAALQSAQIEIYRHRRIVTSELSNSHGFTYNYLGYLHVESAKEFIAQIYQSIADNIRENELTITDEEVEMKADTILKSRLNHQKSFLNYFKKEQLTEDDKEVLSNLRSKSSTDANNKKDLMYFAIPFQIDIMVKTFETYRTKIVDEIKSFGARSKNQLVQNYWLSTIDQSYPKNLQKHLDAIKSDLKNLMDDANHTIAPRDEDWDVYTYRDGEPIKIPAPKVPPVSAQELQHIITNFYIKPLEKIAEMLQKENIFKKLPANKSWYLRYPLYATKMNIGLQKKIISTVIDQITIENIIAAGQAFATGGLSSVPAAVIGSKSPTQIITPIALGMLDIDFTSLPTSDSYLKSAASHIEMKTSHEVFPGIKKYFEGKGVTEIITDVIKQSGPAKRLGEAWKAHERTARSY